MRPAGTSEYCTVETQHNKRKYYTTGTYGSDRCTTTGSSTDEQSTVATSRSWSLLEHIMLIPSFCGRNPAITSVLILVGLSKSWRCFLSYLEKHYKYAFIRCRYKIQRRSASRPGPYSTAKYNAPKWQLYSPYRSRKSQSSAFGCVHRGYMNAYLTQ